MHPDHDVLKHIHVVEQANVLECPRDAYCVDLIGPQANRTFPVKGHGTAIWLVDPRENIEKGCLACAVRPYDGVDRARFLHIIDALYCGQAAKFLGYPTHFKKHEVCLLLPDLRPDRPANQLWK